MKSKVALFLVFVLMGTSLIPVYPVYRAFVEMILSQQEIYRNQGLLKLLGEQEFVLKKISKIDADNESYYHELFTKIQDQKLIYGDDAYFSQLLQKTLVRSFLIYLILALVLSISVGSFLSVHLHKIYTRMFENLEKEKERSRYLTEISKWQDVAKFLAHEVKKPIQPIKVWLSQITKYNLSSERQKNDTVLEISKFVESIRLELTSLSTTMDLFQDLAVLPKPKFERVEINYFFKEFYQNFSMIWENVTFMPLKKTRPCYVNIDPKLIRNAVINIIDNASEANSSKIINFQIQILTKNKSVFVELYNTGVEISEELRLKIFEVNYTTASRKNNKGLGLAIVKSTILEHHGEIFCVSEKSGARFVIKLPLHKE